jgi:hypothetical protein
VKCCYALRTLSIHGEPGDCRKEIKIRCRSEVSIDADKMVMWLRNVDRHLLNQGTSTVDGANA